MVCQWCATCCTRFAICAGWYGGALALPGCVPGVPDDVSSVRVDAPDGLLGVPDGVHTYARTYARTYMYVHVRTYVHAYVSYLYTYVRMYTYAYTYVRIYVRTYVAPGTPPGTPGTPFCIHGTPSTRSGTPCLPATWPIVTTLGTTPATPITPGKTAVRT